MGNGWLLRERVWQENPDPEAAYRRHSFPKTQRTLSAHDLQEHGQHPHMPGPEGQMERGDYHSDNFLTKKFTLQDPLVWNVRTPQNPYNGTSNVLMCHMLTLWHAGLLFIYTEQSEGLPGYKHFACFLQW